MPNIAKNTYEDPRPITSIWFGQDRHIKVGSGRPVVEAITAYEEKGPGDFMTYLAVWRGGNISDRIPLWMVRVRYGEAK